MFVVSLLLADYQTVNILGSFCQVVKHLTPDRIFCYCTLFYYKSQKPCDCNHKET